MVLPAEILFEGDAFKSLLCGLRFARISILSRNDQYLGSPYLVFSTTISGLSPASSSPVEHKNSMLMVRPYFARSTLCELENF